MSRRLREVIRLIRECKTKAEEREVVAREAAEIRTAFSKGSENRPRNIAKLLYITMLGYPTQWGQVEIIKSLASPSYVDKRIGYLGLNILLDENQEVLMLATHSMKIDLLSNNQMIAGLALTTLGNIASEQICRDCAPEIEQLLENPNFYLQKKAALCALKIIKKVPEFIDQFKPKIKTLLGEKDHGVLIGGISLMIEMSNADEPTRVFFREKALGTILKLLRSLVGSNYAPEYDVGNISDPFLQAKLLQLLRVLGTGDKATSEKMNEILASIATNTDPGRNVGNAILYECVSTIMAIEGDGELRGMAINILGKFLTNRDNNIRYVALNTLSKLVDRHAEAVQRHRNTIIECLKDADITIRRRALHLIYSLVDATNVKFLVKELLNFLVVADSEFRADLTAKLCYVSEKFSPSSKWYTDTILRVLEVSGDHVPEEVSSNFIATVGRENNLQPYVVHRLYALLQKDISQQSLNQVGVWCIGEFGDVLLKTAPPPQEHDDEEESLPPSQPAPDDVIDLIEKILDNVTTNLVTRKYCLTALLKLSVRFNGSGLQKIQTIVTKYQQNINIELQQRASEYHEYINWDPNSRSKILAPLPPYTPKTTSGAESTTVTPLSTPAAPSGTSSIIDLFGPMGGSSTGVAPPSSSAALLAGLLGPTSAPTGPAPSAAQSILGLYGSTPAPATGGLDILGGLGATVSPVSPSTGFGALGVPLGVSPTPLVGGTVGVFGGLGQPLGSTIPGLGPSTPSAQPTGIEGLLGLGGGVGVGASLGVVGGGLGVTVNAAINPSQFSDSRYAPITAFENQDLSITLYFKKPNPAALQFTLITALVKNNTIMNEINDFTFLAAPPKHAKYQLDPLLTKSIPVGGSLTQTIKAANSEQGQKPLMMKIKISYTINGQLKEAESVCKNFPADL
eukprot:TRINITY_DN12124_c0_g1_i1.p1 TRINITY_DN12124_c0_g1~~TRINITY_DN12124_c0_g1_i1.p1  ORF type:complete len:910 (-),score=257.07 TRINITY_DN12124_c0_g1_i1:67-2796(-)